MAEEKDIQRFRKLALNTLDQHIETLKDLGGELESGEDSTPPAIRAAMKIGATAARGSLVWVTGIGTSQTVGERFAHILTDCGVRAMFLSPAMGLHGHSGVMKEGDILVAMSRGGESEEVNQMAAIAKERGVKVIGMAHNTESTLADLSEILVPARSKKEYELMGCVATTSTIAFSAVCDCMAAVVREITGYTPEDLGRTHPGGAVGRVLGKGGKKDQGT